MTIMLEKKKLLGFRIEGAASPKIGGKPITRSGVKLGVKPPSGTAIGAKFGTKDVD